jgi:WD40 repeat protein
VVRDDCAPRALGKAIFPIIVAPGGERFVAPDIQQLDLLRDREGGLQRLAGELTRLALDAQGGFEWDSRRAPYPGLLAFEQEDAAVFFGRDDDARRLIERLNAKRIQGEPKLVALFGASGAGKSSVVRAGVLPRLRRDVRNWIIIPAFRPQHDPIGEFARAASEALGTPQHWRELRDRLASADGSRALEDLGDALRVRTGSREAHILVTIDQSEELFAAKREDSEAFFRMITWATSEPVPFIIFLVLRSDHLDRLQQAAEAIPFEEISLGRFPLSRVRQIIEGPARVAGFHIDERLAASAILDMEVEDALPLLAFAMREVFDSAMANRKTQPSSVLELSWAHYQALGDSNSGLNPLENAVRKRADEVVDAAKLSAQAMNALRDAFVGAMVRVDDDGQYLRRPALWHDLPEQARPAIERLADARLLVISTDSGFPIVEVAHEALLRKWPRLREWLDQERDFLVGKAQLRYALNDWTAAAATQKHAALLRGLSLDRARQWLRDHTNSLSELEQTYIKESIVLDDSETRKKKRRRQLSWAAVTALVVLSIAALSLVQQRRAATVRADAAALAIQAGSGLSENPVRAAGLAAQAVEKSASVDTHSILLESVLAISPYLLKVLDVTNLKPSSLAWDTRGENVLVGGWGRIIQWNLAAVERAAAVREVLTDQEGQSDRSRWMVQALSSAGTHASAVMQDGRRVTFGGRDFTAPIFQSLVHGDLAKVSNGPDGTRILVARRDEPTVVFLDCRSNASACTQDVVATGYATALALGQDRAAVGFDNGVVRIIGLGSQQFTREIDLSESVVSLDWASNDALLAMGTLKGQVIVADADGSILSQASATSDSVAAIAWNPRAMQIAAACGASAICVWELNAEKSSLQAAAYLPGHSLPIQALAWRSDGRMLASAADSTVRIWSVEVPDRTWWTLDVGATTELTDLDVSRDRAWLAVADARGDVHVWSLPALAREPPLRGDFKSQIKIIAWSPQALTLAVADGDGRVTTRNWPDDGKLKTISNDDDYIAAMRWLPGGTQVVTSGSNEGAIKIRSIDGAKNQRLPLLHKDSVTGLAVSSDGSRIYSVDAFGKLWTWDVSTRRAIGSAPIETGAGRDTVILSQDERRLLVAGNDGDVVIYPRTAGEPVNRPIRCRSGSKQLDAAAFGPNDLSVYAVSADAKLHIWSLSDRCDIVASASLPVDIRLPSGQLRPYRRRHLAVIRELKLLAITLSTGEVRLISLDTHSWLERARGIARFDE